MSRTASIARHTSETRISVRLDLDGGGQAEIATGIGFLDHMLTALARHAGFTLQLTAEGDLHIDAHHTVEDCGIAIGRALGEAMGDGGGIARFGQALVPMDEALVEAAIDVSGRGLLAFDVAFERPMLGTMDTQLVEEFFRAFAANARITLHLRRIAGSNAHHVAEASFKAVARAVRMAVAIDPRVAGAVPSTKGVL